MNKQTKRIRRNKIKNKSRKYYGGSNEVTHRSKGIFDIIGDKISGYSGKAFNYVKDKSLRLAGLQPIKQPLVHDNSTKEIDQKINEITDAASNVVSDVKNVVNKGSTDVINDVNDVLSSPEVSETVNEAAEETAEISEKLLENFNETLSSPELKEETKEALDNAADYAEIAVEAMDEPINKAVDSLNKAGTKATSGVVSGVIKVGTDALAAIPGVGAIVELGKMANDASAAVGDVVEASSDATSTISKVVEETSKNIDEGLDKLEEKKEKLESSMNSFKDLNKDSLNVSNRINKSINQFENPVKTVPVLKGGRKTRRKLLNHKYKTKRVRFAV